MAKFIEYEKSMELLQTLFIKDIPTKKVMLLDSLGMYLANDIVADKNEPEFPTASMDGYAIKANDQKSKTLKVLGDNPAGNDEKRVLKEGEAIKTFTGSKMPDGSDTLIPIENVTFKDGLITINEEVPKGFATRPIGESYKKGDVLIKRGTKITYAEIGVLAGLNYVSIEVASPPKVAVLSTGSEILELGECSNNPAQIRSSNNYTIEALSKEAGAEVNQIGVVKDDKDSILKAFKNAISSSDIIVSTGGVSVGDYDFVKDIVPSLGFEVVFKGVAIKPGKHIMVAKKGEKIILALPGFAYSSTITAILYLLPLIANRLGKDEPYRVLEAELKEDFKKRTPFSEFRACNLYFEKGKVYCDFKDKKVGSSAILINMLNSAGVMIAPSEDNFIEKGSIVKVIAL